MKELKEAVQAAEQYLCALVPDLDDLQVEEVELSGRNELSGQPDWHITLSFVRPKAQSGLAALSPPRRVYKQFDIVDGEVRSMKIRELSGA